MNEGLKDTKKINLEKLREFADQSAERVVEMLDDCDVFPCPYRDIQKDNC